MALLAIGTNILKIDGKILELISKNCIKQILIHNIQVHEGRNGTNVGVSGEIDLPTDTRCYH